MLPNRTAPTKEEERRRDTAGGVLVHVRGHIPILVHIPVRRGGTLGLGTAAKDLGAAPYPVLSGTGPGPGMKEEPSVDGLIVERNA